MCTNSENTKNKPRRGSSFYSGCWARHFAPSSGTRASSSKHTNRRHLATHQAFIIEHPIDAYSTLHRGVACCSSFVSSFAIRCSVQGAAIICASCRVFCSDAPPFEITGSLKLTCSAPGFAPSFSTGEAIFCAESCLS